MAIRNCMILINQEIELYDISDCCDLLLFYFLFIFTHIYFTQKKVEKIILIFNKNKLISSIKTGEIFE